MTIKNLKLQIKNLKLYKYYDHY